MTTEIEKLEKKLAKMRAHETLDALLDCLNERQTEFFGKMYPKGPTMTELPRAVVQISRTLKNDNDALSKSKEQTKLAHDICDKRRDTINSLQSELGDCKSEIAELTQKLSCFKNPTDIESAGVQEDLDFLEALRAAGVDNWDGYDYAIDIMRGEG